MNLKAVKSLKNEDEIVIDKFTQYLGKKTDVCRTISIC